MLIFRILRHMLARLAEKRAERAPSDKSARNAD